MGRNDDGWSDVVLIAPGVVALSFGPWCFPFEGDPELPGVTGGGIGVT